MSDLKFSVSSDTTAAQRDLAKLSQSVDTIQRTTSEATAGFQNLAKSIAVAAAAFGSINIASKLADAVTQLDSKIKLVTNSTKEFVEVQQVLINTSIKTRSTIASTLNVYSSFAKSVDKAKVSLKQLELATDVVQKAVAISGSSTESSNAALIQLSQGLQSGVLRGEELNSVLEQTPRIAQAIADGMGLTLGQMRAVAAEGRLTADVVFDAILSQSEKINKEFGKTGVTISSALSQLGDGLSFVVGNALNATGASSAFAKAIVSAANAVKTSFSSVETYAMVFSSRINRMVDNTVFVLKTIAPVFTAIGDRISEILPVISFMKLSMASLFSIGIFQGFLNGLSFIDKAFSSIILSSDRLRIIFGNFSLTDKLASSLVFLEIFDQSLPTIGLRLRDAFASKTLEEFKVNIDALVVAIRTAARPINTLFRDTFLPKGFYEGLFLVQDYLAFFGFMDKKLIRIGNIRFDVLNNALNAVKAAFGEILSYDIGTKFSGLRNDIRVTIYTIGVYIQQMGDLFQNVFGRIINSFGKVIATISGAPTYLVTVGKLLEHAINTPLQILVSSKVFDLLANKFAIIAKQIRVFERAMITVLQVEAFVKGSIAIGKVLEDFVYSFTGTPIMVALRRFGSNVKEAFVLIYNELVSSQLVTKVGKYISGMIQTIISKFSLNNITSMVKSFAEGVINFFFLIYDAVVGHSYWPDMVEGVIDWTNKLVQKTKQQLGKFKSIVQDAFNLNVSSNSTYEFIDKIRKDVKALVADFKLINPFAGKEEELSRFLPKQVAQRIADATVSGIEAAMRVVAVAIVTLFAATFVPAIRTGLLALIGVQLALLFSKGIESAFGGIMDSSLFGQLGESIGTTIGIYISKAVAAIPGSIQLVFNTLEGFGKGLLDELGVIGATIRGISNFLSGGEGNLVFGLFGGAAGIATLLNGKAIIKSILSALMGTTSLKDKTVFDTFFNSIFGTQNRAFILGGVASLLSAFSDQVNILQATLVATPLLLTAIIGKDVAGKVILDIVKLTIANLTAKILAYMATASAGSNFLAKLFGVDNASKITEFAKQAADKIKSGLRLVSKVTDEERKKQYLAGEMSLRDYINGLESKKKDTGSKLNDLGFIMPSNVGNGPRKAAQQAADDVKVVLDKNKNQLSIIPYISGSKDSNKQAMFEEVKSFGQQATDYLTGLGAKWEQLSARRKTVYKALAIASIGGLAFVADDANAATSSSLDNISKDFSKLTDTILNNLDKITLAMGALALVFRKTGTWGQLGSWIAQFTGLDKVWSKVSKSVIAGAKLIGRALPLALGVTAAATALGVIGVALFGEGDTLTEKFQNAYQWTAKILNLREANTGRQGEILAASRGGAELRKESNANAVYLENRIKSIDFSKLTNSSFKEMKAIAEELSKLETQALRELRLEGEIQLTTSDSLDKMIGQLTRLMDRAESKSIQEGLRPRFKEMQQDLASTSRTYQDALSVNRGTSQLSFDKSGLNFKKVEKTLFEDLISVMVAQDRTDFSKIASNFSDSVATNLESDLKEVDLGLQAVFDGALNKLNNARAELRDAESGFELLNDPERLKRAKIEFEKALDSFDNIKNAVKEVASRNREIKSFEKNVTLLGEAVSKAGLTFTKSQLQTLNPTTRVDALRALQNANQLKEAKGTGAEVAANQIEADRRILIQNQKIAAELSTIYLDARAKYLADLSGIQIAEADKLKLGIKLPVFFDKQEEIGKLKQSLGTIRFGTPGAIEKYQEIIADILAQSKELEKVLNSLKPPSEALAERGSKVGISVNKDNLARYGVATRSKVESNIQINENTQNALNEYAKRINAKDTTEASKKAMQTAMASLEKDLAVTSAITGKLISTADEYLTIRDTLESFDFKLSKAGLNISRDIYALASGADKQVLDQAIKDATAIMDRAKGKEGISALRELPAILDRVSTVTDKLGRTTAQLFTASLGETGTSIRTFGKLGDALQTEIIDLGASILETEGQLSRLKGKENTTTFLELSVKLDEQKTKRQILTDTRSQFSRINDVLPKLELQTGFDETQFNTFPAELKGTIFNITKEIADLIKQSPDYDSTNPLTGALLDPEANAKIKAALLKGRKDLQASFDTLAPINLGKLLGSLDLDVFEYAGYDSKTKDALLKTAKDLLGIEREIAELQSKPIDSNTDSKIKDLETRRREAEAKKTSLIGAGNLGQALNTLGLDVFKYAGYNAQTKDALIQTANELLSIEKQIAEIQKKQPSAINQSKLAELATRKKAAENRKAELVVPTTFKDQAELLKIDLLDIVKLSDPARLSLVSNRIEINKLQKQLEDSAGMELGLKAQLLDDLNRRLAIEARLTDEVARRNTLNNSFNSATTNAISANLKGEKPEGGINKVLKDSLSAAIVDSFAGQVNKFLFEGVNKVLSNVLSADIFGMELGATAATAMWVQMAGAGSNGLSGGGLLGSIGGLISDGWNTLTNSVGATFGSFNPTTQFDFAALSGFADGGVIPGHGTGAVPVVAHAGEVILNEAQQARVAAAITGSNQVVNNINITGDISRQTKTEIMQMLPQIAGGVNAYNRENNIRR